MFACEVCKSEFTNKSHLTRHMKTNKCNRFGELKNESESELEILRQEMEKIKLENTKLHTYKELYDKLVDRLADKPSTVNQYINLTVTPDMVPISQFKIPSLKSYERYITRCEFNKVLTVLLKYNFPHVNNWSILSKDVSRGKGIYLNREKEWINTNNNELGVDIQKSLRTMNLGYRDSIDEDDPIEHKLNQLLSSNLFDKYINNDDNNHRRIIKQAPTYKERLSILNSIVV